MCNKDTVGCSCEQRWFNLFEVSIYFFMFAFLSPDRFRPCKATFMWWISAWATISFPSALCHIRCVSIHACVSPTSSSASGCRFPLLLHHSPPPPLTAHVSSHRDAPALSLATRKVRGSCIRRNHIEGCEEQREGLPPTHFHTVTLTLRRLYLLSILSVNTL
jgi:hypothetical protein